MEFSVYSCVVFRAVEAQHAISTHKLVDSFEKQHRLERLIDQSKPSVVGGQRNLHYLLYSPFRYRGRTASRFREPIDPPVFYAAERAATAMAEVAFHTRRFWRDSPDTPVPKNPKEFTVFTAEVATGKLLDLTAPPHDQQQARWSHPTDYAACQQIARSCRKAGGQAIRSLSVRDPDQGANMTLLTQDCFVGDAPLSQATWRVYISLTATRAECLTDGSRLWFSFDH